MSQGKVVQIIGAVVDLEFPQDAVPKVYDALKVTEGGLEGLVLEVQQQLGGGIVRAIAMGTTDGLRRGITAKNSGEAIWCQWVRKPSAVLWMCWVIQSMKRAQLVKKRKCLFTVPRQAMKINRTPTSY